MGGQRLRVQGRHAAQKVTARACACTSNLFAGGWGLWLGAVCTPCGLHSVHSSAHALALVEGARRGGLRRGRPGAHSSLPTPHRAQLAASMRQPAASQQRAHSSTRRWMADHLVSLHFSGAHSSAPTPSTRSSMPETAWEGTQYSQLEDAASRGWGNKNGVKCESNSAVVWSRQPAPQSTRSGGRWRSA